MKRFTHIAKFTAALLLFAGLSFRAQAQQEVFNQVSAAIQKGDAAALSGFFNATLEVTLPGADQAYAANQAQFVVKDFFAKNAPKSYKLVHTGESGGTWYATGLYTTASGAVFDSNIFLKKVGDKFLITQIRFEAD